MLHWAARGTDDAMDMSASNMQADATVVQRFHYEPYVIAPFDIPQYDEEFYFGRWWSARLAAAPLSI